MEIIEIKEKLKLYDRLWQLYCCFIVYHLGEIHFS